MTTFKAYEVSEIGEKEFAGAVVEKELADLPDNDVLIQVKYSSLNYKDALSASGNKGVTRNYPHTPGIDAAGVVVSSADGQHIEGAEVLVIGYDLGMNTSGGFGQYIKVPASWVVPLPDGLDFADAMRLGTAGFTAALCVEKLIHNGVSRDSGAVLVTGATGGVGIVAVMLLSQLGFDVTASTGKSSSHEFLKSCGAAEVIDRAELSEQTSKPLLAERWAGAVDVVGGATLCNVIKSLRYGASVSACGLVQSPQLEASVLPFILRGVNLLGVDSVELPLPIKQALWKKLAGEWKLGNLHSISEEISLSELDASLKQVLSGQAQGRFLLNLES
ncbi:MAG: YhdH/YhfP family quinone oxidoreductase [Gammaproteobacteria bacterium]